MLPDYHHHVKSYENTLITKFFGLHRIIPSSGQKVMCIFLHLSHFLEYLLITIVTCTLILANLKYQKNENFDKANVLNLIFEPIMIYIFHAKQLNNINFI